MKTGACASLSLRLAWLLKDGVVLHGPVPMEPGDATQPTPVGSFRVAWKDKVHTSSEYGDPMPNSVFFAAGGIAFHAGALDRPSHGCIHLTDADSAVFFDSLPVGAEVEVTA
jgi:lipoprotein-anchoring transpeptidase ErfK/SrfK